MQVTYEAVVAELQEMIGAQAVELAKLRALLKMAESTTQSGDMPVTTSPA